MIKPHDLISYLFTFGKLVLPGIGTVHLEQSPARSAFHEFRIYGPKIRYQLTPSTQAELSAYRSWLTSILNCDDELADKFIENQANEFRFSLKEQGEVIFPYLGRIYLDERDKVMFDVDKSLQKSIEFAYPDLPLHFFPGNEPMAALPKRTSVQTTIEPQINTTPWYVWLAGMLLTSVLLSIVISYFAGFNGFSDSSKPITVDTTQNSFHEEDTLAESIFEDDQVLEDTSGKIQGDTDDQFNSEETEQPPSEPERSVVQQKPAREVIPEELKERLSLFHFDKEQLSNPLIIVTGSFKKASQANRMLQTIESKGFRGFVTKFGEFYRTGVLFDLPAEKSDSVLSEIKSQIEKDAWILTD